MSMDYSGTPGDYTYSQTANGKSVLGVIAIGSTSDRDLAAQRSAGGADRLEGDQGGHLMADRFGGRNDPSNLDAQAANVNQKDQANVERNVSNLASNPNNTVSMSVANFNSVGDRPDATMINVGVRDNVTGQIDEQHISFQNASHEMQESWNETASWADMDIDPSQDAGMTAEQREAANELCGAENEVDDRLGSGWSFTDFDESFLDAGTAEGDVSEASMGDGMSSGETSAASMESGMSADGAAEGAAESGTSDCTDGGIGSDNDSGLGE